MRGGSNYLYLHGVTGDVYISGQLFYCLYMELHGKTDIKLAFSAAHDKEILELDSIQFECM